MPVTSQLSERRALLTKRYSDPIALLEDRDQAIFAGTPYSYKLTHSSYAIDAPPEKPEINESEMSATNLFASGGGRDRKGDLVNTMGIQDGNHRKNPIAMLDHGLKHHLPIGKTESPNGEYTVTINEDFARAKIYYSQSSKEALDVFLLKKEGILRAGSIGYRPIRAFVLPPDPVKNLPSGLHLAITELLEVTDCAMPCNPETAELATQYLSRGRIEGKSLSPIIKEILEPLAQPKRAWARGWSYEPQGKAMPKTNKPSAPMGAPNVSTTSAKAQEKIPNNPSPKGTDTTGGGEKKKPMHYGLQLLERLHEDLGMLSEDYHEMGEALEPDSQVRPHIDKFLADVEKWKSATAETHGKTYPDADPLSDPADEGTGTAAEDMEAAMANDTGSQAYDPNAKSYKGDGKTAAGAGSGAGPHEDREPHKAKESDARPINTGPGTAAEGSTGVNHPHMESIAEAVAFLSKLGEPGMIWGSDHRILAKHHANKLNEARHSLLGPEAAHQKDSMPTKPEAGAKPNTLGSGGPQDVGSMDGKNYDRALEAELDAEIARELAATEEANKMLAQAG